MALLGVCAVLGRWEDDMEMAEMGVLRGWWL
jgi:hypothetical protein